MRTSSLLTSHDRFQTHVAHFYQEDGELLRELKTIVGNALERGSSAIAIVTEGHRKSLMQSLKIQGIDLRKAAAEGRFVALDATALLTELMSGGRPDPERFARRLGPVMAAAMADSLDEEQTVVVFGEMVALLWSEGSSDAAIEMEKLWNELSKRYFFSNHCAYPSIASSHPDPTDLLARVCAEHSAVVRIGAYGKSGVPGGAAPAE
jgi:MEDS: MEthanogen/methylotroph, DcmR Sensory domain